MAFFDNLQYKTENLSLYFQGGVRRSVLIFAGVCLVLLAPFYFLGQLSANIWHSLGFNPNKFNTDYIVVPKTLDQRNLEFSETQMTPLASGENALYLTVNNKVNPTLGFSPFIYKVQALNDKEAIVAEQTYNSYLLPGDVKYIIMNSPDNTGVKLRVQVQSDTQPLSYNPEANKLLKQPKVVIKSQDIKLIAGTNKLQLRAVVKNEDTVFIQRIDFLYIIRDSRQSVVGIGEYFFNGFEANTEREFVLEYPAPKDRTATIADIRWSVNYLDKNVIKLK